MHGAKVTSDELKAFYTARAQIEEDYAKKLLSLARKPLGSSEIGTLRMSLDVVRGEVESMGKAHQIIASQMKSELEEPLVAFTGGIRERRKIVQGGIEKLVKVKSQQMSAVNKARDRFEQDCLKVKGYLAQGHMVMGQEERKNKAKLERTQIQMSTNSTEYEAAVKALEETTGRWNREWKAACDKFQDLEEERLDFFKSSLWSFANIASTVCVSDDQSCEKIRLSLEDCEVEKDIVSFIKDSGTGQEIPDAPKYINFCRGDVEENGSVQGSDDDSYSVAQFPRTMNPTYRTSSPQPSTMESHNGPESSLRDEMDLPKSRTSLQGDEAFMNSARSSHGSAAPPPLVTHQPTVPPPMSIEDVPPVPHNPYPTDGMTQFCRMGPPSENSSNQSPTRPGSRDSQERSDYSAPTSFSSVEPTSTRGSPTKQYNESNISSTSSGPDDRQLQKKKSGFFQSHSPFRRRSQKTKELPQSASVTPTSRNTWTPATVRKIESANASPTKPFSTSGRANTWNDRAAGGNDPDPDPRADYQLGIGNSVFDVASPDSRKNVVSKKTINPGLDPIAQALAELKGFSKESSARQSADRHYGMPSPGPSTPAVPAGAVPTAFANTGNSAAPPPAYDRPVSRLGAPQPAHTSREMQKTTERFVAQKRDMFNSGMPRPSSGMGRPQENVRAASSGPPRSASPRAFPNGEQRQQQQMPYRSASPNPYAASNPQRPRVQSANPMKQQPSHSGQSSRGGSPGYQVPRAASPNPAYNRPPSSRGSDPAGGGGAMALQLAQAPPAGQDYCGSQRGGRPRSQYYPSDGGYADSQAGSRTRSHSVGGQRQYTKDGRPILHYGKSRITPNSS